MTTQTTQAATTITVKRGDLLDAFKVLASGVAKRPAHVLLTNMHVRVRDGHATLTTTDYDTFVQVGFPASGGDVDGLLPFAQVDSIVKGAGAGETAKVANALDVTLTVDPAGSSSLAVDGYVLPVNTDGVVDDYPEAPDAAQFAEVATFDRDALVDAVASAKVAVGNDDTLPVLTHMRADVSADGVTLYSTDRFRLARVRFDAEPVDGADTTVLLPPTLHGLVARLPEGPATLAWNDVADGQVRVQVGNVTVTVRGNKYATFPAVESLLVDPTDDHTQARVADVKALVKAATKAEKMNASLGRNEPVGVRYSGDGLRILPKAEDGFEAPLVEGVDVTVPGADVDGLLSGFNGKYLLQIVKAIKADNVLLYQQVASKPMFVQCGADVTYALMPLRLHA